MYGFWRKLLHLFFARHALTKAKIWLLNFDFHQVFWSERLIHSKKRLKRFCISSLKKIVSVVLGILTSGLIYDSLYPISGFSIFAKIWKYYLCLYLVLWIKFCSPIFISFGYIKCWTFQTVTNIYTDTYTNQFSKTTVLDSGDFKTYKSG